MNRAEKLQSSSGYQYLLRVFLLGALALVFLHLLSFFGLFIGLAYPALWAIYPKMVPCLSCRIRGSGNSCSLCGTAPSSKQEMYPKTLKSAVKNGGVFLMIWLVSLAMVGVETVVLYRVGIYSPPQAVSFTIPSKSTHKVGEVFPVDIVIAGSEVSVNTVQADLGFDKEYLRAVDIITEDSFAEIFIQKQIDNEVGYLRLTGGSPNPGYRPGHKGEGGIFGTIFFEALRPGMTKVEYLPSSLVLANDGKGTNILRNLGVVSVLILDEELNSSEETVRDRIKGELHEASLSLSGDKLVLYDQQNVVTDKPEYYKPSTLASILSALQGYNTNVLSFWGNIVGVDQ